MIIENENDLRNAYTLLHIFESQKFDCSDEIIGAKREIRNYYDYKDKANSMSIIRNDSESLLEKIEMPREIENDVTAENYFNGHIREDNYFRFPAIHIYTYWHKIVRRSDGRYLCYANIKFDSIERG